MAPTDMTDKLRDLANYTTGFAIAQSIATAFALAKGEWRFSLRTNKEHYGGLAATVVFTIGYIVAVLWCWCRAKPVDDDAKPIWTIATWGRIVAILLFTTVTVTAFLGHRKNVEGDGKSGKSIPAFGKD